MKYSAAFILGVFFIGMATVALANKSEMDKLMESLDHVILNHKSYMLNKEKRIDILRSMSSDNDNSAEKQYDLNLGLIDEYQSYITDSALHFIEENLKLAEEEQNSYWIDESKIRYAIVFAINGMHPEAIAVLKSINRSKLNEKLTRDYYSAFGRLYEYLSQNSVGANYIDKYQKLSNTYNDSAFHRLSEKSNTYIIINTSRLITNGDYKKAQNILIPYLKTVEDDEQESAIVAYLLAMSYRAVQNTTLEKKYFILSAINDIKGAIKENASLKELATILYAEGDIEHAYRYIKFALDDATFCNAKHRQLGISQALPIIDNAYRVIREKNRRYLIYLLLFISVLSVFLIGLFAFVYKQKVKLGKARKDLFEINNHLSKLNTQLNTINFKLKDTNSELREANHIKEEYVGHFMNLCSLYIDKLDDFQKLVGRKIKSAQVDDLLKMTKSKRFIDAELKEFYTNFDHTFLHLFPNFVQEFNALLSPEHRFEFKQGDTLNTEMRIFALIRLGISDSFKIANFLRYSSQTIYNYRTKVKNKALADRDEFEQKVLSIGNIKKAIES